VGFLIGFLAGVAAGFVIVSAMTDDDSRHEARPVVQVPEAAP
jgi:hypothetical protein